MGRVCSGVGCVQGPLPPEPRAEGRACLQAESLWLLSSLVGAATSHGRGRDCPFWGPGRIDGWKAGSHGDEEQRGTETTLQKRCFVLASRPGATLAVGSVRAAFVGLPGHLLLRDPLGCPFTLRVAFLPLIGLGRRRLPRTACGDL